jgi:hypothetical protein
MVPMRVLAIWCVALTLGAAALFGGARRVAVGGNDTSLAAVARDAASAAAGADAGARGSMAAVDPSSAMPNPVSFIGPGIAIGAATLVGIDPSSESSRARHALARLGIAAAQSLPGAPRTPSVLSLPLRI